MKLTAVLVRHTYGYHQSSVKLKWDEMTKLANLSKGGLSIAIKAVEKRGFFRRGRLSMWHTVPENSSQSEPKEVQEIDNSSNREQKEPENSSNRELDKSLNRELSPLYKKRQSKIVAERKGGSGPFPYQGHPSQSATVPEVERKIDMILSVCGLNRDIPAHLRQCENAAAQLTAVSVEEIKQRYTFTESPNGRWYWYRDDWRGQKGQQPKPREVVETATLKPLVSAKKTAVSAQESAAEKAARIRQMAKGKS